MFVPTEIAISFQSAIPKQVLRICDKPELQVYLIHPGLNAKWDISNLPLKC